VFLKICGITNLSDALHAVDQGATALGFVLWPRSPRYVTRDAAARIVAQLPATMTTVGVFVNESSDEIARTMERTNLTAVQLHGDEPPTYGQELAWPILKSVTLATAAQVAAAWSDDTTLLLDAADRERRGGTGQQVDWAAAAALARARRLVLAGGLTPANVADAIAAVRPYGVDVSSGVEDAPGVKNPEKVAQFLAAARKAMMAAARADADVGRPSSGAMEK
jgi:phosphoribosylanthranilate isomerase